MDGLRPDIRAGVALHRPRDLDSAFSLALLHEELLEAMPQREFRRPEQLLGRGQPHPLFAIAAPLPRTLLPAPPTAADDWCGIEAARAADRRPKPDRGEDRLTALRNYRRARGLCFKCGERWGQGHQCAATVQLHVVKELLELLQAEAEILPGNDSDSEDEELMSISKLATTGQTTPRTLRLLGYIADQEVLVLVDSGSSHNFISEWVAAKFAHIICPLKPVSVNIADGGMLSCSGYIPHCQWETQQQVSTSDLRCCPWVVMIW